MKKTFFHKTTEDQAQIGRYSLKYTNESDINSFILHITIESPTQDATRVLGESLSSASLQSFDLIFTDGEIWFCIKSLSVFKSI